MDTNHKIFQEQLRASDGARWNVAKALVKRGYTIWVKPVMVAPTADRWEEFVDDGDLGIDMRLEVKQRPLDFTCKDDFPYPNTMIVCGKKSFDRAKPKPLGYVILNRTLSHYAFVRSADCHLWKVEHLQDHRYNNYWQDYYLAPLDSIIFAEMLELNLVNHQQETKDDD